jgi:propanediol utilization protein
MAMMWNFKVMSKKLNMTKAELNFPFCITNSVSTYDSMNRFVMLAISNRHVNVMSSTHNILFGVCKYLTVC